MDEDDKVHSCDLCKVNYTTDNELEDHNWSLMHHIKVEKLKKGAPHSCNLCMQSCSNIIEYGKHLVEDRHKLALSRRDKETNEMLDSFSGSGSLFNQDNNNKAMPVNTNSGHQNTPKHMRFTEEGNPPAPDYGVEGGNWQLWHNINTHQQQQQPDRNMRGRDNRGGHHQGPFKVPNPRGHFKVPRGGRRGHMRTYSDRGPEFKEGGSPDFTQPPPGPPPHNMDMNFYADDFHNFNWNDSNFYGGGDSNWNPGFPQFRGGHRRRGSFDSSYNRFDQSQQVEHPNCDGSDRHERPERGRKKQRDGMNNNRRSMSYDNISPESTSSSDSGLKRRRENDGSLGRGRGKSRRKFAPDTSLPLHLSMQKNAPGNVHMNKARSRSSSRDMLRDSGYGRSETESDNRYTWRKGTSADQVSSSSEKVGKHGSGAPGPGNQKAKARNNKAMVLPDSSSESEGKKKHPGNGKKRNVSPRVGKHPKTFHGQPNNVLEKAEKLCKKLRSERENAKMKKKYNEKNRKIEREKELTNKIESLAQLNKSNIKGVLDSGVELIASSTPNVTHAESLSGVVANTSEPTISLNQKKKINSNRPIKKHSQLHPPTVIPGAPTPNITDRIAQTKADIDAIRAKIESSVNSEMSQSGSSTDTVPHPPKYPQATDRTSLVKMVNSPRTTKERLSLAQMLRSHAQCQTKLSLPRFNLKYSDLCSDSDKHDEFADINVESLAPSVQLQIANIIEADIKPNVTELEKLLDHASEGIVQLDANVLSHLGFGEVDKMTDVDEILSLAAQENSDIKFEASRPVRSNSPQRSLERSRLNEMPNPFERSRSPVRTLEINQFEMPSFERSKSPVRKRPEVQSHGRSKSPIPTREEQNQFEMPSFNRSKSPVRKQNEMPSCETRNSPAQTLEQNRFEMPSFERSKSPTCQQERSQSPVRSASPTKVWPESSDIPYLSRPQDQAQPPITSPSHQLDETQASDLQQMKMPPPRSVYVLRGTNMVEPEETESLPVRDMPPPRGILNIDDLRTDRDRENRADRESRSERERHQNLSVRADKDRANSYKIDKKLSPDTNKSPVDQSQPTSRSVPTHTNTRLSPLPPAMAAGPASAGKNASDILSSMATQMPGISVKQEKEDTGYDAAMAPMTVTAETDLYNTRSDLRPNHDLDVPSSRIMENPHLLDIQSSRGADNSATASGRFSPVQRSVHTKHLYNKQAEVPVRDNARPHQGSPAQGEPLSAVDEVSKILDAVPVPEFEPRTGKSPVLSATAIPSADTQQDIDCGRQFDSSVNSQSTVLDEVYRVSLREENVRQDISTVDIKISKLRHLIEEASEQLEKCAQEKQQLVEQEMTCRTKRLKLLEESRSSSSCSQKAGVGSMQPPNLPSNMATDHPVMLKFLMSQPQSDGSSVAGYSNVETGSQPDLDNARHRSASISGSVTSNMSERVSAPVMNPVVSPPNNGKLFSRSIDVLSGSTETLTSDHGFNTRDSETVTPKTSGEFQHARSNKNLTPGEKENINSSNSVSLLNRPLEKVGFVTLEALMKGDTDIGKLLNKSLESIEKGTIPVGASVDETPESMPFNLQKQASNWSQASNLSAGGRAMRVGERRDSNFSISSDGGSDSEKRRLSMKYMGTLPEGINYEAFVKQVSEENKNKSLMFTVFSSPEATTQLRRTPGPDAGFKTPPRQAPPVATQLSSDMGELDNQSVLSNYSLGEQIKQICDRQNTGGGSRLEHMTPRSGTETLDDVTPRLVGTSTTQNTGLKLDGVPISEMRRNPVKDCSVLLEDSSHKLPTGRSVQSMECPKTLVYDMASPIRKRLKSKKERDQMSRRKQKESFILKSDSFSEEEAQGSTGNMQATATQRLLDLSRPATKSEDDLVLSGSEDHITPRADVNVTDIQAANTRATDTHIKDKRTTDIPVTDKSDIGTRPPIIPSTFMQAVDGTWKSLLDEVQLETETQSDSGEDKSAKSPSTVSTAKENVSRIEYPGASLSVACIQEFQGDLYVCYNGSEIRRFDLKTGRVLKELDCSPYLVSCLLVTSIEERQDILYTGGSCRKLMLFEPQKFNLIASYDYSERITCLHENWGRLFVGLADGEVSVRSLNTDKEMKSFTCATSAVQCIASTSAGMTKMLCLATGDSVIYVLDAGTGLLLRMLEGHTQPALHMAMLGEGVVSGGLDHTIMIHYASTGDLVRMAQSQLPVTYIHCHEDTIYTVCGDNYIRTYTYDLKLDDVISVNSLPTCSVVAGDMLIVGYRNGLTEAQPISKKTLPCKNHLAKHLK